VSTVLNQKEAVRFEEGVGRPSKKVDFE